MDQRTVESLPVEASNGETTLETETPTLYKPLPTEHHIRLLTILPGESHEIRATLTVVDESARPIYQCLSYTWGPPKKSDTSKRWFESTRRIVLDGSEVLIQPNIDDALHRLRRLGICSPIWIDALCINQNDNNERGSQVSKMDQIYSNATEVIVWLGTQDPRTVSAIQNMKKIGITNNEIMEEPAKLKIVDLLQKNIFSDDDLINIFEFSTELNWFTRIWTVQEMLLARHLKFMCGTTMELETVWGAELLLVVARAFFEGIPMGYLQGLGIGYLEGLRHVRSEQLDTRSHGTQFPDIDIGAEAHEISKELQNTVGMKFLEHSRSRMNFITKNRDPTGQAVFSGFGLSNLLQFGFLRGTSDESRPRRLLSVLAQELREKEATDPRDKLYGIMGIAVSKIIGVDYLKTPERIFTEAATLALTEFEDLSCLSYIGQREPRRIPLLPSWVPDYTVPLTTRPLASSDQFHAGTRWQGRAETSTSPPYTLTLEGAYVGTVATVRRAHWIASEPNCFLDLIYLALNPVPLLLDSDSGFMDLLRNTLHAELQLRVDPAIARQKMEVSFQRWLFRQIYTVLAQQHDGLATSFLLDPVETFASAINTLGISDPLELLTGSLTGGSIDDEYWRGLMAIAKKGSAEQLFSIFSSAFERDTFTNAWTDVCTNRSVFRTEEGYFGLGPNRLLPGDRVYIIKGARVPYVFRSIQGKGEAAFELRGEVYIQGFMDGEAEARIGRLFEWTEIIVY